MCRPFSKISAGSPLRFAAHMISSFRKPCVFMILLIINPLSVSKILCDRSKICKDFSFCKGRDKSSMCLRSICTKLKEIDLIDLLYDSPFAIAVQPSICRSMLAMRNCTRLFDLNGFTKDRKILVVKGSCLEFKCEDSASEIGSSGLKTFPPRF